MVSKAGRPRGFDADDVLDRAVSLFWTRGYRTTTTRDLEQALGISQSSLYNAFGSKESLFTAALDRYEQRTATALIEPLETSTAEDGLDAIDDFLDALVRWVTGEGRGGCMIINLMAEDGGETPEIARRTRAYRARVRSALEDALKRRGDMTARERRWRADLLFGSVLGINVAARGGSTRAEVEALTQASHALVDSWR